ncbi:Flp pilus assembly protein TadC [Saccharomonospora marina XMU15]|uniref:Flp pilus assembly protein TadC n=1 Tax=Saccharomonospora marina XMU15 TaxID=882083 RepID=H5X255_9PSEU|nr:type II secretion system F family protein [Saccharomonospora marina]EHR53184.1 Flp pilus assembly protein TadC [Saccharomonospora marina XMU15]
MTRPALAAALLGVAVLLVRAQAVRRLRRVSPTHHSRWRSDVLAQLRTPAGRAAVAGAAVATLTAALGASVTSLILAVPSGMVTFGLLRFVTRARSASGLSGTDRLRIAMTADLLAACLSAGLAVPASVRAVASTAPAPVAAALLSTAELLALGAEPAQAWEPVRKCQATAELARAATRTARSGSALSGAAAALAQRVRAAVADEAEAQAQRAGVLITAPLGLCFLPAFLCLGVLPVVIGLATGLDIT